MSRRGFTAVRSAILAVLCALSYASAQAAMVAVTGINGEVGALGVTGDPGGDGGVGGAGESVAASAGLVMPNSDSSNEASARGGRGGQGGQGGHGLPAGANGGAGGQGGGGGDALAYSVTSIDDFFSVARADASAVGGMAGVGGEGGFGNFPGSRGAPGPAGSGGSAVARSSAINLSGPASANSRATAGAGISSSDSVGVGGDAVAAASAIGAGTVMVNASADGTTGLSGSHGHAALDGVVGVSTGGGAVAVHGLVVSADALHLVNQVDGQTTGGLYLDQTATGADGASVASDLSYVKSADYLSLRAEGNGGDATTAGGAASSRVDAINVSGSANANVTLVGGDGPLSGGDVNAIATASSLADGRSASVGFNVGGGDSFIGGAGGAARGDFLAQSFGDGAKAHIFGFLQGGVGRDGSARLNAVGIAHGDSVVSVSTHTRGGWGGTLADDFDGHGSDATATVSGGNAGASDVFVNSTVAGGMGGTGSGDGGIGSAGGHASGTVDGYSSGGGRVFAGLHIEGGAGGNGVNGAAGSDGADAVAVDGVTGGTSGQLMLSLGATGGQGGSGSDGGAGRGGDASAHLTASNRDGDDVQGSVFARGGQGGYADSFADNHGGDGGNALVGIHAIDVGAVTARATGNGGHGQNGYYGSGGAAGVASSDGVSAESTGNGAVRVELQLANGDGGSGATRSGDGPGLTLTNAVQGITSGPLELVQWVQGGSAGSLVNADQTGGTLGTAGAVSSTLSGTWDVKSLFLWTDAVGGNGGSNLTGDGGAGAEAAATSVGENRVGSVGVQAAASGGAGGRMWRSPGQLGGAGGVAVSLAEASSHQDGKAARATSDAYGGDGGEISGFGTLAPGSRGGRGGNAEARSGATSHGRHAAVLVRGEAEGGHGGSASLEGNAGAGGDASSDSHGDALADGPVSVDDFAYGGHGGNAFGVSGQAPTGEASNGGAAASHARGRNAGTALVFVNANAMGGDGGLKSLDQHYLFGPVAARGGDAHALAEASSSGGGVTSTARATAGMSANASDAGNADARATASGVTGTARATSESSAQSGVMRVARADAEASVGSRAVAESRVMIGAAAALATTPLASGDANAQAELHIAPGEFDVAEALAGHVTNLANFVPGSDALALGTLQTTTGEVLGPGAHHYTARVEMQLDVAALARPRHLLVGLLDAVDFAGFDSLTLSWAIESSTTVVHMAGAEYAHSYFSDRSLDLADLSHIDLGANQLLDFYLQFEVGAHGPARGFGFTFLLGNAEFVAGGPAPVPLPGPALLFLSGLVGIGGLGTKLKRGQTVAGHSPSSEHMIALH